MILKHCSVTLSEMRCCFHLAGRELWKDKGLALAHTGVSLRKLPGSPFLIYCVDAAKRAQDTLKKTPDSACWKGSAGLQSLWKISGTTAGTDVAVEHPLWELGSLSDVPQLIYFSAAHAFQHSATLASWGERRISRVRWVPGIPLKDCYMVLPSSRVKIYTILPAGGLEATWTMATGLSLMTLAPLVSTGWYHSPKG